MSTRRRSTKSKSNATRQTIDAHACEGIDYSPSAAPALIRLILVIAMAISLAIAFLVEIHIITQGGP